MIGAKDWKVEANSPNYLHLDWLTGVFGKDAIPDGDGRAGGGTERGREEMGGELLRACEGKGNLNLI
jgi:hypothetical protein